MPLAFVGGMKEKRTDPWSVGWFLVSDLYYGMWQTGQRGGRGTYPRKTEVSSLKIKVKNLFSLSETVNYQQQQKHIPPRFIVVEKNMFLNVSQLQF